MLKIIEIENLEQIYEYQMGFHSPYFFQQNFATWKESFADDVDGEGRVLFKELYAKAAYDNDELIGFVQYGKSAFGFDGQGNISFDVSYQIIRNLYFDYNRSDAGGELVKEELLKLNGFKNEHENVYYSSVLNGNETSEVKVVPHDMTRGNQQYIDFLFSGNQVGGCEVHFLDGRITYLRWIYVNENITGRGVGTKCMNALKQWLSQQGITRLDTDTAVLNLTAQRYYEKNGFTREGITRSYYLE